MLLGEKLMNSITKRANKLKQQQEITPKVEEEEEEEEGIDDVYDNVEALLEVFRTERHQEKLRSDEEIQTLRNPLALVPLWTLIILCIALHLADTLCPATAGMGTNAHSHMT